MSDITVYDTEQELREALTDMEDLLKDFEQTQQTLDEQRAELAEQVQGALAKYEARVADYESRRDDLDQRQAELTEFRNEFELARDQLQMQLDAKQDAKLGRSSCSGSGGGGGSTEEPQRAQSDGMRPVSKEQIEKLKSQLSKPELSLELTPPGGLVQADTIDKDLKLGAKIQQKQTRLTSASINMQGNWNRNGGPKP